MRSPGVRHEIRKRYSIVKRILRGREASAVSVLPVKAFGLLIRPVDWVLASMERLVPRPASDPLALVFVLGLHRSGSTFVAQVIADALTLSPLDNLTAMFPRSGYFGGRIARIIRRLMGTAQRSGGDANYTNFYGVGHGLTGVSDCNEMWDLWLGRSRYTSPERISDKVARSMQTFFEGLQSSSDVPLLVKSNRVMFHMTWFAERFPNAFFVVVTRDPVDIVRSVLKANEEVLGDRNALWGMRPSAAFDPAAYGDIVEAACAQTVGLETVLGNQLVRLPEGASVEVSYERFCSDPDGELARIAAAIKRRFKRPVSVRKSIESPFRASTTPRQAVDTNRIRDLVTRFRSEAGRLSRLA